MKFLKAAFSQRRKKLKNAILNNAPLLGIEDIKIALEKLPQIMIERRAETISPEELAGLSDILAEWKKQNLK
jgi:16S rRNA (adenine1518-N6/adenine1519-N6)-dimethyltransferase